MKLVDPTAKDQIQENQMAPRLEGLEKKRIGILVNGKANSKELLLKTARLFEEHHNCEIVEEFQYKTNAGAPADHESLQALASKSDFLLTANGD